MKFTALLLAILIVPDQVRAAPFCAVFGHGRECFYFDMTSCRQAAGTAGMCVVNQDEVQARPGGSPFCVVSAAGAECSIALPLTKTSV